MDFIDMTVRQHDNRGERGVTILEFAITASVFFMMLVGIVAGGVFFWTHNALVEATRRGARYATLSQNTAIAEVKNVVVYGNPAGGGMPLAPNLEPAHVTVTYSLNEGDPTRTFGVGRGTVTVGICQQGEGGCTPYEYNFVIPGISETIPMPPYRTTLPGESAGYVPADK